ncbi:hypothetical protein KI387_032419, partial [Taxus chinensis]
MTTNTPKAIIFNKYGQNAHYKTEIVPAEPAEDAPRLLVSQPRQNKYCCCLELPEFSVTSDIFIRKKDAEQAAAKLAIEKLGIQLTVDASANKPLTEEEKWKALKDRLSSTFTEKFILSHSPLVAHFKAAVQRQGDMYGLVPAAVLAAIDNRIVNLCKSINSKAETDPVLSLALVLKAAKSCGLLHSSLDSLWIGKREPFSIQIKEKLVNWTPESTGKTNGTVEYIERTESLFLEAVYIPSSEKSVESLTLKIDPHDYFVDVIAHHLSVRDSSHLLISRILKKAPLESRLYFPVPNSMPSVADLNGISFVSNEHGGTPPCQLKFNSRASNLVGQKIHGDVILAAVGSTWRSFGTLSWENINLSIYNRMLLSRTPRGNYKLSRDAILVAELPTSFTTRSRWHGALPRDLLVESCHHYLLSDPDFFLSVDGTSWIDSRVELQNSKHTNQGERYSNGTEKRAEMLKRDKGEKNGALNDIQNMESDKDSMVRGPFVCVVKILSKTGESIIECASEHSYRSRTDAIQSASLKALHHKYFKSDHVLCATFRGNPVTPEISDHVSVEDLNKKPASPQLPSVAFCISDNVFSSHEISSSEYCDMSFSTQSKFLHNDEMDFDYYHDMTHLHTGGSNSGKAPTSGTIACISYRVCLIDECVRECLEHREDFEFEIGTGAVIPQLEVCVTCISVNESKSFCTPLPPENEILAAAGAIAGKISRFSLGASFLEYNVELLRMIEPMEERMEQALFSPPLSKQRMEYALHLLSENSAKCLVDLGCGSGSLFDTLLDQETDLVHIVGVDISEKSLGRAAKILHSKLSNHKSHSSTASVLSASLYYGSITEPDQRICGFDVATCIE